MLLSPDTDDAKVALCILNNFARKTDLHYVLLLYKIHNCYPQISYWNNMLLWVEECPNVIAMIENEGINNPWNCSNKKIIEVAQQNNCDTDYIINEITKELL